MEKSKVKEWWGECAIYAFIIVSVVVSLCVVLKQNIKEYVQRLISKGAGPLILLRKRNKDNYYVKGLIRGMCI